MDEALEQMGFGETSAHNRAPTPVVADPEEHPISREPVDPERVIADLRAAALREDTRIEPDREQSRNTGLAPRRRSHTQSPAGRRLRVGALIVDVIAMIVDGAIMAYGLWAHDSAATNSARPAAADGQDAHSQSAEHACEPSALTQTINRAVQTQDEAVVNTDASLLDGVLGGELLDQDRARIASMQADGVRVAQLSSRVDNVSVLSCQPGAIDVAVTLTVLVSETCRADACDKHTDPNATELVVRIDPVSGKVVKAQPADVQSGAGAHSDSQK